MDENISSGTITGASFSFVLAIIALAALMFYSIFYGPEKPISERELQMFTSRFYNTSIWIHINGCCASDDNIYSIQDLKVVNFTFSAYYPAPDKEYDYQINWTYYNPKGRIIYSSGQKFKALKKSVSMFADTRGKVLFEDKFGYNNPSEWELGKYQIVVDVEGIKYHNEFTLISNH